MGPINLAIIGAGNWARDMHLPCLKAIKKNKEANYLYICDLDTNKAQFFSDSLNAEKCYDDVDKMFNEVKIDGVIILVPPMYTADIINIAIKNKTPFFAEKPPASSTTEQIELIKKAGDLINIIGYNRRFSPYIQQAVSWLENTNIQSVSCHFSRYKRYDQDFSTTAVHAIDTTTYLLGDKIKYLHLEGIKTGKVLNFFINGWSGSGIRFDIQITPATASAIEHYFIRSEARNVNISFPQHNMLDLPGYVELYEKNQVKEKLLPQSFDIEENNLPFLGGIYNEHLAFINAIKNNKKSISTLESTLQTQEIREFLTNLIQEKPEGIFKKTLEF